MNMKTNRRCGVTMKYHIVQKADKVVKIWKK
jgi:hypothetical protein